MNRTERDALLAEWKNLKEELEVVKQKEAELRKKIVAKLFDKKKETGTENLDLGGGWSVKAVKKLTYSLRDSEKLTVEDMIKKLPEYLHKRIAKKSFSLSVVEYNILEPNEKKIVDQVLTIKPGTPSLSLVPPKGE